MATKRTKPSVNAINAAVDAAAARMLVVSTGHIPGALANEATAPAGDAPIARIATATGDYGWLVNTGHSADYVLNQLGASGTETTRQAVLELLHFAKRRGFHYILFDADGEELPQFTLYDW